MKRLRLTVFYTSRGKPLSENLNKTPRVSILIPCYNTEKWVAQAIESAIAQSYKNTEIIVADDGSSDNSLAIIKSFDGKIKFLSEAHRGANATRNRLLRLSSGEWLQYLDADDCLLPDKISAQIEFAIRNKFADVIYSPVLVDEYSDKSHSKYLLEMPDKEDFYINLIRWGPLQTTGILWKKTAISDAGLWNEGKALCNEHELMLRMLYARKTFALFDKANSVYRRSDKESVSRKDERLTVSERMRITDRIEKLLEEKNILTRERRDAINISRFESARYVYDVDPALANSIMQKVDRSDCYFKPSGKAAPMLYNFFYSAFGFETAEKIAKLARRHRKG